MRFHLVPHLLVRSTNSSSDHSRSDASRHRRRDAQSLAASLEQWETALLRLAEMRVAHYNQLANSLRLAAKAKKISKPLKIRPK
jgi:hypothetical protein